MTEYQRTLHETGNCEWHCPYCNKFGALVPYAGHYDTCASMRHGGTCTCGFAEAFKTAMETDENKRKQP